MTTYLLVYPSTEKSAMCMYMQKYFHHPSLLFSKSDYDQIYYWILMYLSYNCITIFQFHINGHISNVSRAKNIKIK